jgi:hypothetical protein
MAERQAAQGRLQRAQEKAEARAARRERVQHRRAAPGAVSWGLLSAAYAAVTIALGIRHGLRTGLAMTLISVIVLTLCALFDRHVQPRLGAWVRRCADRMDARMERRLAARGQDRER